MVGGKSERAVVLKRSQIGGFQVRSKIEVDQCAVVVNEEDITGVAAVQMEGAGLGKEGDHIRVLHGMNGNPHKNARAQNPRAQNLRVQN